MSKLLSDTRTDHASVKFLIGQFSTEVPGAEHTLALAADGLLLAATGTLSQERAERMAAIVAGLSGLASEANNELQGGGLETTVVEMANGSLIVMTVSDGSRLAVLAGADTDTDQMSHQMQQLIDKIGELR